MVQLLIFNFFNFSNIKYHVISSLTDINHHYQSKLLISYFNYLKNPIMNIIIAIYDYFIVFILIISLILILKYKIYEGIVTHHNLYVNGSKLMMNSNYLYILYLLNNYFIAFY